jgi:hypothetical protein
VTASSGLASIAGDIPGPTGSDAAPGDDEGSIHDLDPRKLPKSK